jgi:micrococcal nuclease
VSRLRLALLFAVAALVLSCGEVDVDVDLGALGQGSASSSKTNATIERVVDGDTVVLSDIGKARLIGVDTPEVYGGVECYGRAASRFAKRVLDGQRVRWRYDSEKRDRYDRALVYLWLEDGRFFNSMLVREGYAQPLTIAPNVEYADRFVADGRVARRSGRGLWRACHGIRE